MLSFDQILIPTRSGNMVRSYSYRHDRCSLFWRFDRHTDLAAFLYTFGRLQISFENFLADLFDFLIYRQRWTVVKPDATVLRLGIRNDSSWRLKPREFWLVLKQVDMIHCNFKILTYRSVAIYPSRCVASVIIAISSFFLVLGEESESHLAVPLDMNRTTW